MNCNKSTFTGLLFAVIAVACIVVIPSQIPILEIYGDELSPRVFPYILAGAVLGLSAPVFFQGRKEKAFSFTRPLLSEETRYTLAAIVLTTAISGGVYLFGMLPVTTLLLVALCLLLGCRSLKVLAALAVGWLLFAYLVFEVAFNFVLPQGSVFS